MCDCDVIEMGQLSSISTHNNYLNSLPTLEDWNKYTNSTPRDVFESKCDFIVMFEESSRMKDIWQRTSSPSKYQHNTNNSKDEYKINGNIFKVGYI